MNRPVLLLTIGAPPLPVVTPIVPVTTTPNVDGHAANALAPATAMTATPTVDGVDIEWTASVQAGCSYIIEAAVDVSGSPGPYAEAGRTTDTHYSYPLQAAAWVRVRATLNGRVSDATAASLVTPIPSGDIAANAGAITLLTDRVTSAEGTISAQGTALTAVQAELPNKASVSAVSDLTARVELTEAGVANYYAAYSLTLDVNGKISGFKSVNDGAVSLFEVGADVFKVSGGDTGLTLDSTRMDRQFGSVAVYEGNPFGSDNLVLWIGPSSTSKAAATKDNGTFWISGSGTTGGGSMIPSAPGVVYKAVSSATQPVITATAAAIARADGKVREIAATMSTAGANGVKLADNGSGSTAFSVPFVVEVSRDGGGWAQVGDAGYCAGSVSRDNSEPGITTYIGGGAGSITVYDESATGSSLQYRVRETGLLPSITGWGAALQHTVTIRITEIPGA